MTATSTTTSSITQTVTVNFAMPTVSAVTITSNPALLNSTPGVPVSTTLTITNVGNVTYNPAINPTLPSGWTISGVDVPASLAVGASETVTATVTPPAGAPLNSTQNVVLTYGQGTLQDAVSVVGVTPNPSTAEAGTQVDVTAGILAGVTQAEQGTVSYTVTNSEAAVVFTSTPVPISLPEVIGVQNVDLGTFATAGLSPGAYRSPSPSTVPTASPSRARPAKGSCSSTRRSPRPNRSVRMRSIRVMERCPLRFRSPRRRNWARRPRIARRRAWSSAATTPIRSVRLTLRSST